MPDRPLRILILGTSYGLLLGAKMATAGHCVEMIGRAEEVDAMTRGGVSVVIPAWRGGTTQLEPDLTDTPTPGKIRLATPASASVTGFDLAILAMQEPQYRQAEVSELIARIAAARVPVLSIMNMPTPPFLLRLPGFNGQTVRPAFSSWDVWTLLDPQLISMASPDPQAVRPDADQPGHLLVTLASNFKVAPFADSRHNRMLGRLAEDVSRLRLATAAGERIPMVRMVAHESLYVPLAKWPMLITGNCRCIAEGKIRSLQEAVWSDPEESRRIYDWVVDLARRVGADAQVMVPFDAYAKAAKSLIHPSSLARALWAGKYEIERIDRFIALLAAHHGMPTDPIDGIVDAIEKRLSANRSAAVGAG